MGFEVGKTYNIVKSNTILDLAGGEDGGAVLGYTPNGGNNQKWTVEQQGEHFLLKNNAGSFYINFGGDRENGTPVHAGSQSQEWDIKPAEEGETDTFRFFVPGTTFCLDLSDHGNAAPGTPVTLWKKWKGGVNQLWRFQDA